MKADRNRIVGLHLGLFTLPENEPEYEHEIALGEATLTYPPLQQN